MPDSRALAQILLNLASGSNPKRGKRANIFSDRRKAKETMEKMEQAEKLHRTMKPCVLLLQKMELELKCPCCLNLLRRPILLPCSHIVCSPCIPELGSSCVICKVPFLSEELRSTPQMENMVSIYRSMGTAFNAYCFQPASHVGPSGCIDIGEKPRAEQMQNDQSMTTGPMLPSMPSFQGEKQVQASTHPIKNESETVEGPVKFCDAGGGIKGHECLRPCSQNYIHSAKVDAFANEANPALSPFSSMIDPNCKMDGAHPRDVNQWAQTSPESPPSFGDLKDSDDDNNDQGSEHLSAEGLSVKGMGMKGTDNGTNPEAEVVFCSQKDHSIRKPEILGNLNVAGNKDAASHPKDEHAGETKMQNNSDFEFHDVPSDMSKHVNANLLFVCAFCHSSGESEASGPMLHYANGRALTADQAAQANVLHVHRKCIEWAPQVYFVGETAMNLEAELHRASKIKCSSCGKKGAALGCYAKSCRKSFHVPCAVNIFECRWDCENFLVLCPVHASLKLPFEKPKSKKIRTKYSSKTQPTYPQKSAGSPSMSEQSSKLWAASSGITSKWVLCGSALSFVEKDLLSEFVSLTGVTITKSWKPNVTHVIASIDGKGASSRTLKFLMGILNGRWILKIDWIKACMEAKHPVDEEPYEVSLDVHGCCDGPKIGRIRVLEKAPKLFSGLNFHFSGDFVSSYKGYYRDLVLAAGGNVLSKKDIIYLDSKTETEEATHSATLLIYNAGSQESGEESSLIEQRCQETEALAAKISSQVAPHTWILESVAACKLQPLAS